MAEQVNGKRMVVMLSMNGHHLYKWASGGKNCWTYDEPPQNHDGSEPPYPWVDDLTVIQMIKLKVIKKIDANTYRLVPS